ncbi:MAG: J domain-containing protein, partial [Desulfobacterales bacterium]
MYLALEKVNGQLRYIIRESYRQAGQFLSRDLLELGDDPGSYIVYPGGNAFYIDQVIEERLTKMGAKANPDEIEDIFWPFVDPVIRRVLEPYRSREKRHHANRQKRRPAAKIESQLHMFDKRRMHYLKLGRTDQRDMGRLPVNFFRILHN